MEYTISKVQAPTLRLGLFVLNRGGSRCFDRSKNLYCEMGFNLIPFYKVVRGKIGTFFSAGCNCLLCSGGRHSGKHQQSVGGAGVNINFSESRGGRS